MSCVRESREFVCVCVRTGVCSHRYARAPVSLATCRCDQRTACRGRNLSARTAVVCVEEEIASRRAGDMDSRYLDVHTCSSRSLLVFSWCYCYRQTLKSFLFTNIQQIKYSVCLFLQRTWRILPRSSLFLQ